MGLLVVERLADDRANREIERTIGRVTGARARRHPYGAQFQRIVGEQRRVEVIGRDVIVKRKRAAVRKHDAPIAQLRWRRVRRMHRDRPRRLSTRAQQYGQGNNDRDTLHRYPSGASSTTGASFSCPQLCCSAPTTMSELSFGRSAFRTCDSPLSTQMA